MFDLAFCLFDLSLVFFRCNNVVFVFLITYSLLGAVFQNYASQPSLTPDDDVFKHLSLTYANNHAKMSRGVACKSATPQFEQGITNGAAWYPLTGGMQVSQVLKHADPRLFSIQNIFK